MSAAEGGAWATSFECRAPVMPVDVPTPPAQGFRSRCQGIVVGISGVGTCWFGKMIGPKILCRD